VQLHRQMEYDAHLACGPNMQTNDIYYAYAMLTLTFILSRSLAFLLLTFNTPPT